MEHQRDKTLWKMAKKRVAFRQHLFTYCVVNAFLWGLWYYTRAEQGSGLKGIPWPVWATLGWGIALAFSFYEAYFGYQDFATEREYEKLMRKKNL